MNARACLFYGLTGCAVLVAVLGLFGILDPHLAAGGVIAQVGLPVVDRGFFEARKVGMRGQADVVWSPLWDFQQYPAAGGLNFTFFSLPQGQGVSSAPAAGAVAKTKADTNMQSANQLGKGNDFLGVRAEVLFYPGVTNSTATPFGIFLGRGSVALANVGQFENDMWAVGNGGTLKLAIGTDRNYILEDGPLFMFPPVTRMALAAAISNTFDSDSTATAVVEEISYSAWSGTPYNMVAVFIESQQVFTVQMQFPAAIATPSTVAGRIGVRLGGYLSRQVT